MDIAAIFKVIEKLALNFPLGPVVVLASLYFIYDGYKSSNGVEISFAGAALIWSLFSIFTLIIR